MFSYPLREIERIYGKKHTWTDEQLQPGQNLLSNLEGKLLDIDAEFVVGDGAEFGFVIRGTPAVYNVKENRLSCTEQKAPLKPRDGRLQLRMLVERVSIEISANDGRVYMPIRALHTEDEQGLEVFTEGDSTKIGSLTVRELKSIWN